MWKLDCEETWAPKNWCFWTVMLEKTLESPLDYKEIQPVHSKGDQSWVFFGRTESKAETPILWPPHVKSWVIGENSDARRDWGQEEKGRQRMGWLGGITDQLVWVWVNSGCWWWIGRPDVLNSWVHKELDTTEQLNWTEAEEWCNSTWNKEMTSEVKIEVIENLKGLGEKGR